ncbi:hypothetical protein [Endozoicomonas atrinae]|uniref:hypothetical protein n=1 Tax=Endozoicomonas atrinae TaxID=1333660 RepID=UPI003B00FDD1
MGTWTKVLPTLFEQLQPSDSTSIHVILRKVRISPLSPSVTLGITDTAFGKRDLFAVSLTEEPKVKVEREDQKRPGYIVNAENNTRNFCHEALEEIKKGEGLSSITRKALLNRCIEEIYMEAPESERVHVTLLSQSQFKTERNLEQDFQDQLAFVRSERKSLDSEQLALERKPMTSDIQDRLDFIKHSTSELDELESRYVQVIAEMHMSWTPFSKRDPS